MAAITITSDGHNLLRNSLAGTDTPLISYVAFGTSSTPPTVGDHLLGNETYRKAVTSYTVGVTGELLINLYLAPGDIVGTNIQEVGFFGGKLASTLPNTGVLLAHGLYSHSKLATESIGFTLDFTL